MPTYTDSTAVLAELPASPPTEVTNNTATDIADASGEVEALVGSRFALAYESNVQKFPNIASSPATPSIIKLAATYLAASKQYLRLEKNIGSDGPTRTELLRERGLELLTQIRDGNFAITLTDGTAVGVSALDSVEDEVYAARVDPKEIFNIGELDTHAYD